MMLNERLTNFVIDVINKFSLINFDVYTKNIQNSKFIIFTFILSYQGV